MVLILTAKDPNIQFRPHLCVYCAHLRHDENRCEAYEITYALGDKNAAPLYGASFEPCDRFQRYVSLNGLEFVEADTPEAAVQRAQREWQIEKLAPPTVMRERKEWSVSAGGASEEEAVEKAGKLVPAEATEVKAAEITPRKCDPPGFNAKIGFFLPCVTLIRRPRPWWQFW